MTRNGLRFACALLLCAVAGAATLRAQESRQQRQIVVPLPGTGFVAFKTETTAAAATNASDSSPVVAPEIGAMLKPQMLVGDDNLIHRVLVDDEGGFVFGYDLTIEPLAASQQFKVTIKPLSAELERELRARDVARRARRGLRIDDQTGRTLPHSAAAQIIHDGDELALELLVNHQTGVRIIDLVKISASPFRSPDVPFAYPPRDFTLNSVELAVKDFKLRINDEEVSIKNPARACKGALVWFHVPERGRFIFALAPQTGYDFRKIGVIEDNKISFTFDGTRYEWISREPIIAGSGGKWNLWVLYDKGYAPDLSAQDTESNAAPNPLRNASALTSVEAILRNAVNAKKASLKSKTPLPNDRAAGQSTKSIRIGIGSADRIENLLPESKRKVSKDVHATRHFSISERGSTRKSSQTFSKTKGTPI